jgi:hypothetical protein
VGDRHALKPSAGARALARSPAAWAYLVLGLVLVLTRLVSLERSFWTDEVVTVTDYVRAGPREILAGPYIPNNHQLYSLLGWAASSIVGESEVVLRLLSVIPFLAGVLLVTAWLHRRASPLSGVLFLFLATASPLLFDLSRQARGYGLAFLAMAVMIVAALEAQRTGESRALLPFFAGGLVGSLTLPNFGIAFIATALVLAMSPELSRRIAYGILGSALLVSVWYAPHIHDLLESSQQENGAPIAWFGLLSSPIDRVLVPAVLWFGDTFLETGATRFIVVVLAAVLMLSSPLLRTRGTALVLCSGAAATLLFVWATRLYLAPRFVSYLLVPLFILVATGMADALERRGRRPRLRALVVLIAIALAVAAFAGAAAQLLRVPAEAWKEASARIEASASPGAPVLAYVSRPHGLRYYLSRPVTKLRHPDVVSAVCAADEDVVYVFNAYETEPVSVPCLSRPGVRHFRLRQHSYGGEIDVWLIPQGRS